MKWIVITVALVVFLGGGLAAVTWVLGNFEELSGAEVQEVLIKGFVPLDNIAFPVNSGTAVDHYVGVDLRLEIADTRRTAEVEAVLPRIRDAIIRDAHKGFPRRADGVDSIDLVRLKDRARVKANEVLGGERSPEYW